MDKDVQLFLKKLKEMPDFNRVKFVFLYGSYALGTNNKLSDIDFAVYYDGDEKNRFKFLIKLRGKLPNKFDVHIFQDLPLFVRKDVLKGKLIYFKNRVFVYDTAYQIIRDFEDFKKYYYDYIGLERIK